MCDFVTIGYDRDEKREIAQSTPTESSRFPTRVREKGEIPSERVPTRKQKKKNKRRTVLFLRKLTALQRQLEIFVRSSDVAK